MSQMPSSPPPGGQFPAGPTPNPAEANSKKMVCGILAILLGALGIHKFVLGITTPALIMLLVSVLSCFVLSPIMTVIGIIEGVIYLTKTDEQFYNEYMVGKKQWF